MEKIKKIVEKHKQMILDAERYIWANPETGYKEYKTSKYMQEKFEKLGYELKLAEGITGFYTTIDTGKPGPCILILAELDSVLCREHPECDTETGAVHSCGHNAQCATLLGIAASLKEEGILNGLCGKITLCAVPAEELLEIEFRRSLKEKGIIKYFGGKSEFLHRGYFDDCDIAIMVHTSRFNGVRSGSIGCICKNIIYKGHASHAGAAPHVGINALYAATCGLQAVNSLRETFQEKDYIRFHPIITHGGDMVNAIPDQVTIESYVRGASFEAIQKVNKKINQALTGSALSIGANVEIVDIPGYAPLANNSNLIQLSKKVYENLFPEETFQVLDGVGAGSTDMGDLSCVMPSVHPYCSGATGTGHGKDYYITDPYSACVKNAAFQLAMVISLLEKNGEESYRILNDFKPIFATKREFLDFQDSLCDSGDRIKYVDSNKVEIRL